MQTFRLRNARCCPSLRRDELDDRRPCENERPEGPHVEVEVGLRRSEALNQVLEQVGACPHEAAIDHEHVIGLSFADLSHPISPVSEIRLFMLDTTEFPIDEVS